MRNIDGNEWKPDLKVYNGVMNFNVKDVLIVENKKVFFISKKKKS